MSMLDDIIANTPVPTLPGIAADGSFKVTVDRGSNNGRVSSEWHKRPADQRYLDLNSLFTDAKAQAVASRVHNIQSRDLRMVASFDGADAETNLQIAVPGERDPVKLNHWSFGQVAALVGAPAGYLRERSAPVAALCLQEGLSDRRDLEEIKVLLDGTNGSTQLRAANGPDYGRIYDHEIVAAVQRIAGNGIGDARWKVPGLLDWSTMRYNPHVDVDKDNTTLYRSDRDLFIFLVDDTHPIEVGKLPDGSPDYMFRGFYVWNSEVGSQTAGISSMYLRGVCMNRNLWGVEGFQEIKIRHSKFGPARFAQEAFPALLTYAQASPNKLLQGVRDAKAAIVAHSDDDGLAFLTGSKLKLSKPTAKRILETVMTEEQRPARSIWDMVQGITAHARSAPNQDARVDLERKARVLLDAVTGTEARSAA